ncbi:MAG: hypothetical protein WCJ84_05175 [Candidatus Peregrinibacteria bacterium]
MHYFKRILFGVFLIPSFTLCGITLAAENECPSNNIDKFITQEEQSLLMDVFGVEVSSENIAKNRSGEIIPKFQFEVQQGKQ